MPTFQRAKALLKQGHPDDALRELAHAVPNLPCADLERAGRLIRKALRAAPPNTTTLRVLLVGQCTTTWLALALQAHALGQGLRCTVNEGEYDNVLQTLLATPADDAPHLVVLLPWTQRLLGDGDRPGAERVDAEVAFWRAAWERVSALGAKGIQVGYDTPHTGAEGYHLGSTTAGPAELVRRVNRCLRAALPAGFYFVDLERVAGDVGRRQFYDPRRDHWTRQPFSEVGVAELARHLAAGCRVTTTGAKKVLVLDLDNTLWGGVVGETGPLHVELGESPDGQAFVAFQRYAKRLNQRGVLLAVASKNNPDDARAPFEQHPDMALQLRDVAAFEANWGPKAESLARIASTLRLGLDSFVFFDDNPAEREQMRQLQPEVCVVDVPNDPADYVRALEQSLWFETIDVTHADRERTQQYAHERARRESQQSFGTLDDYYASLDMRGDIRPIDPGDLPRVVQLLGKTNQFNLTTRRHSAERVQQLLDDDRAIGFTIRIRDRFGDSGLVSVLIATPADDPRELIVDTWLMSCRVIQRTVEAFAFNALLERARALEYVTLTGLYLPTAKNAQVADLYERLGLLPDPHSTTPRRWSRPLSELSDAQTFVQPESTPRS